MHIKFIDHVLLLLEQMYIYRRAMSNYSNSIYHYINQKWPFKVKWNLAISRHLSIY